MEKIRRSSQNAKQERNHFGRGSCKRRVDRFNNTELANMLFVYGSTSRIPRASIRMCLEHLPNRYLPSHPLLGQLHHSLLIEPIISLFIIWQKLTDGYPRLRPNRFLPLQIQEDHGYATFVTSYSNLLVK
ncbi:hypothetical protein AVEN_73134-1 [Araneus ventricosus]|uniref:DUF4817 domain-containing protein n=1 Tax=Araneus ventricosus TaxID=182803 RepID=A0A4Y2EZU6_ARAVE|nr:hypothetical protein AVEN_73134-1 [Araneus ventricosus]